MKITPNFSFAKDRESGLDHDGEEVGVWIVCGKERGGWGCDEDVVSSE